jgi:hypothetical protein
MWFPSIIPGIDGAAPGGGPEIGDTLVVGASGITGIIPLGTNSGAFQFNPG